jgi:hypothetical protein
MRLLHALAAGATLLGACLTCTQQVQQRELRAGDDLSEQDTSDQEAREERSTELDLEAEVPLQIPAK